MKTKRTFELNGEVLQCPEKEGEFVLTIYGHGRGKFYFKTEEDWRCVGDAVHNILTAARDKE